MMSIPSTSTADVCPVFSSSGKCGERDALRVMEQFRDFYEGKLNEVDMQGGGDCLELKLKIQRRWIEDLTEQTQMMARIVKELEDEATCRVRMLEDKLRQTSKCAYEKAFYLESDLKNVLEFIRRIRDDKKWSIDGLQFYDVSHKDLFGEERGKCGLPITNGTSTVNDKETPSNEIIVESSEETSCNQTYDQLTEQLKKKNQEFEELKQSMYDMRSALTEEVACKHDMISVLKKDVQQLEERCVQSDKQTAFKDDIIKELRKEIKQLKQQIFSHRRCKNLESKAVVTTIRHSRRRENPKCSTVIYLNESKTDRNADERENDWSHSYLKEIPVKEKSKFTMTGFGKGFEQGREC